MIHTVMHIPLLQEVGKTDLTTDFVKYKMFYIRNKVYGEVD